MEIEQSTNLNNNNTTINSTFSKIYNANTKSQAQTQYQQFLKKVQNKGNPQIDLSEKEIIRDIIFAFQGIDGHYIQYIKQDDSFSFKLSVPINESVRNLINKLCELGWLYKKINDFLNKQQQGIINQSLNLAIKEELNEYYRLIAILENLINTEQNNLSNADEALNLRKLILWTSEPLERIKWLSILTDAVKNLVGNQIISAVYSFKAQGNPYTQSLIERIMSSITQPFMKMVNSWIFNGELNDPLNEFFVSENPEGNDIWISKYQLLPNQIPNIIEKELAQQIFKIGKTINFLRKSCNYNEWQLDIQPFDKYIYDNNYNEFKTWVEIAGQKTNKQLMLVLQDKFHLQSHLKSIKQYLLMGQGEFIHTLMEILSSELNKPANAIYKNNLIGLLETAVRNSNAQYHNQENLNRLDIKLLQDSPGDKGWDIFSFDYIIESPLSTVLNPNSMKCYLKIFNFLWRIKRVEYNLSQIWLEHMKNNNLISNFRKVKHQFLKCNLLRNEMNHFINNLFNYIMVEVIESTWKKFIAELEAAKDFDEIINIHTNYVQQILDKCLLTQNNELIYRQLIKIFDLIFRFKYTQDMIINDIQEEYTRIQSLNQQKKMMNIAEHNDLEEDNSNEQYEQQQQMLAEKSIKHFQNISKEFRDSFNELQTMLKRDEKLRFLSFRLDFNEFYSFNRNQIAFDLEELKKYGLMMGTSNSQGKGNLNLKQEPQLGNLQNLKLDKLLMSNQSSGSNQYFKDQQLTKPLIKPQKQQFMIDQSIQQTGSQLNMLGQYQHQKSANSTNNYQNQKKDVPFEESKQKSKQSNVKIEEEVSSQQLQQNSTQSTINLGFKANFKQNDYKPIDVEQITNIKVQEEQGSDIKNQLQDEQDEQDEHEQNDENNEDQ